MMKNEEKIEIYNRYYEAKFPFHNFLVLWPVTLVMPLKFKKVSCFRIGTGKYVVAAKGDRVRDVDAAIATSRVPSDQICGETRKKAIEKWEKALELIIPLEEKQKSVQEMKLWLEITGK